MANKQRDELSSFLTPMLLVCYAPNSCLSKQYARNVFKGLEDKLPNYIKMHAAIADPRKSVSDEVNEIMDRCNQYNIHNITFCGWSNGGLHAIRMATMFKVDEMALLPILLFDTCEPSYFAKYGTSMYNPTQGIMTEFYQQLLPDNVFDIYESLNTIEENKMRDHVISKITETGMDKEITEQLLTKYDILRRKLLDTRKTTYLNEYHYNCNYKAVLFVTSKHRFAGIDKYLGWQDNAVAFSVDRGDLSVPADGERGGV